MMKQRLKRWLALGLAMSMVTGLTVGCGSTKAEAGNGQSSSEITSQAGNQGQDEGQTGGTKEADREGRVKIGFCGWGYTDKLGSSYQRYFNYIADAFDIEFQLTVGDTTEQQMANVENLIQSGCQGIIALKVTSTMMDKCEAAGVYLAQFGSEPSDPELLQYLSESPYWAGCSTMDDYDCGMTLMKAVYDAGARNVVVCAQSAGSPAHDARWAGFFDEAAKHEDLKIVAEFRTSETKEYGEALQNAMSIYPEVDGIVTASASNGAIESVVQTIRTANKVGQIRVASVDVEAETKNYFDEDTLTCIAGGQYPEVVLLALCVLDKINGVSTADGSVKLVGKMIYVNGPEEYQEYETYIEGEGVFPYTIDELKSVTTTTNPQATYQDMWNMWNNYSLQDVMDRHANQ